MGGTMHNGLGPSASVIEQANDLQSSSQAHLVGHFFFSIEVPLSQMTVDCVDQNLTRTTVNTMHCILCSTCGSTPAPK